MAGTQVVNEGAGSFYVDYLLDTSAPQGRQNSLKGGFDISNLQNRATCWAEDVAALFRWNEASTATADDVNVILPLGQAAGTPGRWLKVDPVPGQVIQKAFANLTADIVNTALPGAYADIPGFPTVTLPQPRTAGNNLEISFSLAPTWNSIGSTDHMMVRALVDGVEITQSSYPILQTHASYADDSAPTQINLSLHACVLSADLPAAAAHVVRLQWQGSGTARFENDADEAGGGHIIVAEVAP